MPNLKSLYDVTLKVVQNDGTNVTDVISIKWFDGHDNFLANSPTMTKLTEGGQLYATLSLPEELARVCELPGRVEHTVATTGNDLTLTLQPLQQNTLAVRVVNDADGKYLSGALVQATQMAHGRYSQVVSATTDIYGLCDLTLIRSEAAKLTVALDGYLTESIDVNGIAGMDALPTIRLKPITTTLIALTMQGYDDYKDLYVSVFNNTKQSAVSDIHLQYPYLVLPKGVDDDDVLAITAHSHGGCFPDKTQTMTVKDRQLTFALQPYGGVVASYDDSKNGTVRVMVYDSGGSLVATKKCEDNKVTFSYLPNGVYTVPLIGDSQLLSSINRLTDFNKFGLYADVDYVTKKVTVKQGVQAKASFATVPLLVESNFNYTNSNTAFFCTTANPRIGYAATFRANIHFKDEYVGGVSNLRLIVDYDGGTEFLDGSVVHNTKLHDYAKGEHTVEVDGLENGDEVKFCLMPVSDGVMTTTAYVEFDYNNQHLRQLIGTVRKDLTSVSLVLQEVTSTPEVTINLKDIPFGKYKSVEFYDNGVLIGSIPDLTSTAIVADASLSDVYHSPAGDRGTIRCKLNEPYYYSYHNIQARLTDLNGAHRLTEIKTVQYNPFAVVLADVGVRSLKTGQSLALGQISHTNSGDVLDCGRLEEKDNGKVGLQYYASFQPSYYLPDILKKVTLVKYSGNSTEEKKMGWGNVSNVTYQDNKLVEQQYVKSGDALVAYEDAFVAGESCGLDKLPSNLMVDCEYDEDFERPKDTDYNNRSVKRMKAEMAEKQMLLDKIGEASDKITQELGKSEIDWARILQLAEERHGYVVKYVDGIEAKPTEQQEQLFEELMKATSEEEFSVLCG